MSSHAIHNLVKADDLCPYVVYCCDCGVFGITGGLVGGRSMEASQSTLSKLSSTVPNSVTSKHPFTVMKCIGPSLDRGALGLGEVLLL